jgi:hypothetical protein
MILIVVWEDTRNNSYHDCYVFKDLRVELMVMRRGPKLNVWSFAFET